MTTILYTLFGLFKPRIAIHGNVAAGYEKVRALFESNFRNGMEKGAQCVAYVRGEKVVDLWGFYDGVDCTRFFPFAVETSKNYNVHALPYSEKSLHIVFSAGKCVYALVIAMLVDRGLLRYDEKISHYWPEFA